MSASTTLEQLIAMSRTLGDPALDYAILGEGNSSAQADANTFWVKASGAEMRTIDAGGFVQVHFDRVLSMLTVDGLTDAQVKAGLEEARVDPNATARPSVETVLHALALQLEGINFVGHTHPTAVNAILCSQKAKEAIAGRLFPDEIVYCGPAPVYIPYSDPGVPLAQVVRDEIDRHLDEYRVLPKVILMQNHGLIALGKTASEVENITAMYVKTARVILGAYALGGPRFLRPQDVDRIHTRPDELYRRKEWDTG
ncbi:MAG: class II aldolase/adducin family protein [Anaerolineae bacterium]|jgi:rhamnose utilization protein RhaD (predicted bifunctional aldolase and dehydrogenase)